MAWSTADYASDRTAPIIFVGLVHQGGKGTWDSWDTNFQKSKAGSWGFAPDARYFCARGYARGEAFTDASAAASPPMAGVLNSVGAWTLDATGGDTIVAPSSIPIRLANVFYDYSRYHAGTGSAPNPTQSYGYCLADLLSLPEFGTFVGDIVAVWCHDGTANTDPELLYLGRVEANDANGDEVVLTVKTPGDWGPWTPATRDVTAGQTLICDETRDYLHPMDRVGMLKCPVVFGHSWVLCPMSGNGNRKVTLVSALAATGTSETTASITVDREDVIGAGFTGFRWVLEISGETVWFTSRTPGVKTFTVTRSAEQPAHVAGEEVTINAQVMAFACGLGLGQSGGKTIQECFADNTLVPLGVTGYVQGTYYADAATGFGYIGSSAMYAVGMPVGSNPTVVRYGLMSDGGGVKFFRKPFGLLAGGSSGGGSSKQGKIGVWRRG